jgi:predicted ATP-dependent endonuclease of OLD family
MRARRQEGFGGECRLALHFVFFLPLFLTIFSFLRNCAAFWLKFELFLRKIRIADCAFAPLGVWFGRRGRRGSGRNAAPVRLFFRAGVGRKNKRPTPFNFCQKMLVSKIIMRISQIEINNFRSIKELVITPDKLCALIGPNSTGKTNILRAIDLVLGEGWTTKAKVARELFNDTSQPIVIEITFLSPIKFIGRRGDVSVSDIKLEMTLEPELTAKTTFNGGNTFYDHDQFKKLCHFIFIPSERQLGSELRVSHWTMLGKLMRLIYENYIDQYSREQDLKDAFAEKIKPAKDFLESDFSTEKITYKKFVETFKKFCKENSAGLANEFDPVLDIYNLNWFYKTLQIHVKEKFPDRHFDSEEVGAGMQNLLLISIFQTYAELMGGKVIFGIEEPEIYLYPQAQRSLYKNFVRLSENTQIFYTTHNPNFVDAFRPEDLILLRKNEEQGTFSLDKDIAFNAATAEKLKYKIYTHFNPERNELFFARRILLVEGDSDKILFSTLCEKRWNIDIDEKGVSIISCGGKTGVHYFIGVCKLIGLEDYFAVWDKDGDIEKPELLKETIDSGKGLEIDPNLEGFIGLPIGENAEKVKNAHVWAIDTSKTIPSEFDSVKLFLSLEDNERVEEIQQPTISEEIDLDDIPF